MLFVKAPTNFQVIKPLYQAYEIESNNSIEIKLGTKLYEAYPTIVSEPIYILDRTSIIHSRKKDVVLKTINDSDIDSIFQGQSRDYILKQIKDVRVDENWMMFKRYVFETDYAFNDPMIGEFVDIKTREPTEQWKELVHDLFEFNCKKDPSITLSDKAVLPRGFIMAYRPHKLVITPPHVGKSTFGEKAGLLYDKVTRVTMLGSVKGGNAEDKIAGLVNDLYYLLTIEQIESQQVENLLGYLLTFLESGRGMVSGAGADMKIEGTPCLNITMNPTDLKNNRLSFLRDAVANLCRNSYALGRRFGLLVYGNYAPLEDYGYDSDAHETLFKTYRALEDRAIRTLEEIWYHPKIQDYCLKSVYELEGEDKALFSIIQNIDVIEVRSFLRAHISHASPHIRGGSINCAIVDLLPVIVLRDIFAMGDLDELVDKIIKKAEEYVVKLKEINKQSILFAVNDNE